MKLNIEGAIQIEIPSEFKTYVSEEHFANCIQCGCHLLDDDKEYFIEKIVKDNQVELEYAICTDCMEKVDVKLSEESKENIKNFMESRSTNMISNLILMDAGETDYKKWLESCIVTGEPFVNDDEYQIAAHCVGKNMVLSIMPYKISFKAMEQMQDLLSAQTKEELDNFRKQNLDLPPELFQMLTKKPFIFV